MVSNLPSNLRVGNEGEDPHPSPTSAQQRVGLIDAPDELRPLQLEMSPLGTWQFIVDDGTLLELETASEDRGRVIGRQGRVAKAMRAVLQASRAGADCRLDIVD